VERPGAISTPNRAVKADVSIGYASGPIFAEASEGRALNVFLNLEWKPTSTLRIQSQWPHQRLNRGGGGSWFSTAKHSTSQGRVQLTTRDIFFRIHRAILRAGARHVARSPQRNPLVINGTPQQRLTQTEFRNDFLFSYKPTPGTVFFLGYGSSLSGRDPFSFRRLSRTGDGFFLKRVTCSACDQPRASAPGRAIS